jgi:hypothetical protein
MAVSSPMSAQAKGEPAAIELAIIQTPKAMIPIEIKNENAASMMTSIPKTIVQPTDAALLLRPAHLLRLHMFRPVPQGVSLSEGHRPASEAAATLGLVSNCAVVDI